MKNRTWATGACATAAVLVVAFVAASAGSATAGSSRGVQWEYAYLVLDEDGFELITSDLRLTIKDPRKDPREPLADTDHLVIDGNVVTRQRITRRDLIAMNVYGSQGWEVVFEMDQENGRVLFVKRPK